MRTWFGRTAAVALAALLGLASQLPGAAARCGDATELAHLCCCRAGAAAPQATAPDAGAPTHSCCASKPAPADAPPTSDPADADGCRCTLQAPALPFESLRFAPMPVADGSAVAPPTVQPAAVTQLVLRRAAADSPCHAPPAVGPRAPRGPPIASFDSIA